MSASGIILPGDTISRDSIPEQYLPPNNKELKIGPGLQRLSPTSYKATASGALQVDGKRRNVFVESNGGRYIPQIGDNVIATVHHSSADNYYSIITPHTPPATLPHLSFEGANRKTRPHLNNGQLVYARIAHASKHSDPELECVHPSTNKADGLGPLKGGMAYDVSLSFAKRLNLGRRAGVVVLEELAKYAPFEVVVGKNGKVWVDAEGGNVKVVLGIGRALREADERVLTVQEQMELVERIVKGR
jgi:exosome complex component RRP40